MFLELMWEISVLENMEFPEAGDRKSTWKGQTKPTTISEGRITTLFDPT